MTLNEMLESPEAKKMYRELSKKFHPDKKGNVETQKKINIAKDKGDTALTKLYKELTKDKTTYADIKDEDFEEKWKKIKRWLNQIRNEIDPDVIMIPRKNVNGTIFINIRKIGTEIDTNIFNAVSFNSKEALKREIKNKIMKMS